MIENKNRERLIREAQRAFMESYAVDMDSWSALREEQETWCSDENASAGGGERPERREL